MSGHSTYEPKTGFTRWLDARLPIVRLAWDSFVDFPTPKNLNYWWTFGGILALCLGIQIATGVILAMHYNSSADLAFNSVEHIMRDVNHGWMIRYIHATGASMFFLAVYIHMLRGIYYGSYKAPRELLWILGCVIYLLMMATAFMGYVLPWGQMSYFGAVVITNLLGALPVVGKSITTWLWGGFAVDNPTLNRFFSLHYLLPFMIAGVVVLHIWALHVPGNNNPTGVEVKSKEDTVPFHPYYTVKDGFAMVCFLILFAVFVFFMPDSLGHVDNYVPANPLQTPVQIVPEWYFLPFYAILRAIPDKLTGVLCMFGAVGMLFVLPWLDHSKVRSMRYRPTARLFFLIFIVDCLLLGLCGSHEPNEQVIPGVVGFQLLDYDLNSFVWLSRLLTTYYFVYFVVITPLLGLIETTAAGAGLDLHAGAVRRGRPALRRGRPGRKERLSSMLRKTTVLAAFGLALAMAGAPAFADTTQKDLKDVHWSFEGPFGKFDQEQLQRGYKVYHDVCSTCHSMNLLAYRNLADKGGPFYSPKYPNPNDSPYAKAIAKDFQVPDVDTDTGEAITRPATPSDHFKAPFPNDYAAKAANGGSAPPDLSLMAKAREGGPAYIYSILTGYQNAPAGLTVAPGKYYNPYYPGDLGAFWSGPADKVPEGGFISMPPPLKPGLVTFADGTNATVSEEAKDVVAFLAWAAEPHQEERKKMGFAVMLYLLLFTGVLYASYRTIWAKIGH